MNSAVLAITIAVISALGGGWAFLTSIHQNRKLQLMEQQKADSQAFQRAQEIYERGIHELSRQTEQVRIELERSREMISSLRNRVFSLENVLIRMRAELIYLGVSTAEFDKALEQDAED